MRFQVAGRGIHKKRARTAHGLQWRATGELEAGYSCQPPHAASLAPAWRSLSTAAARCPRAPALPSCFTLKTNGIHRFSFTDSRTCSSNAETSTGQNMCSVKRWLDAGPARAAAPLHTYASSRIQRVAIL